MKKLINEINDANLSIFELSELFCNIIKDNYGEHNYKSALNIINTQLIIEKYCECGRSHGMHDIDNNNCSDCDKKIFP